MLLGIDISSHQGVPDFPRIKADGYSFVVIKVTGGNKYVNDYFEAQYQGALAAGLLVGLYHYDGEPTVSTGTAEEEAAHFTGHLPTPLPPGVFLALDVEETATRSVARYLTFCTIVEATMKRPILIYTYHNFITESDEDWTPLARFKLWYAAYPNQLPDLNAAVTPTPPAPWSVATIWQYSGGLDVPGSPNATDADRFVGTRDDLLALGGLLETGAGLTTGDAGAPVTFAATGYTVQGGFLKTYQDAGADAVARYGYPVTGELTEVLGGQQLTVQYFERARFEFHHDTNLITFGRVGAELAHARGYTPLA